MVHWVEPLTARHPRTVQRAAADALAGKAGPGWALRSRSHSRGTVAVAMGNAPLTRLGVDVEYADPRRPWRDIGAAWLPEVRDDPAIDAATVCRLWTFGEAYFKAFGSAPAPGLLRSVRRAPAPDDEPVAFAARRYWYSEALPESFWLTLVWEEEV